MHPEFDKLYAKLSDEEKKALSDYVTAVCNNYLNTYQHGSIEGVVLGVVGTVVSTVAATFISWKLTEAMDNKGKVRVPIKTETTDSE